MTHAELADTWERQARATLDRPTMPPLRDTDEWCGRRGAANRLLNVVKAVRGLRNRAAALRAGSGTP